MQGPRFSPRTPTKLLSMVLIPVLTCPNILASRTPLPWVFHLSLLLRRGSCPQAAPVSFLSGPLAAPEPQTPLTHPKLPSLAQTSPDLLTPKCNFLPDISSLRLSFPSLLRSAPSTTSQAHSSTDPVRGNACVTPLNAFLHTLHIQAIGKQDQKLTPSCYLSLPPGPRHQYLLWILQQPPSWCPALPSAPSPFSTQ